MEYRAFGKTGLDVSAIGFGCWELGGAYGHIEENDVVAAIHKALDVGISLFDTAEAYGFGQSEALLAKGLGDRRKDIVLVSKFGVGYASRGGRARDGSRERMMKSIETTLSALNTDYLDVYLVHWPDRDTPFDGTMRALEDIVQQGKTRFVGVSNFKAAEIAECMSTRHVDVGQYGYHLFDRRMEVDVFPYCADNNIAMMAYGPLAHGLLTGAFDTGTSFEESDWRSRGGAFNMPLFTEENFPRNLKVVEALKDIARERGKAVYELALAWVLSNPVVSVALVGARTASEVQANLGAVDLKLSAEDKAAIDAVFTEHDVDTQPSSWVD
ncbi:MAG: aldo/keto reductase [Gammaproteobacteria bacterium]|nr:aldo/keto reductase [Gammaproteobacteria bacterium]